MGNRWGAKHPPPIGTAIPARGTPSHGRTPHRRETPHKQPQRNTRKGGGVCAKSWEMHDYASRVLTRGAIVAQTMGLLGLRYLQENAAVVFEGIDGLVYIGQRGMALFFAKAPVYLGRPAPGQFT
ncbi:hypothetical protein Cenrod_1835 [Candidatus Symbiobacter mobilis CR]|uniref:Uncharacterized protein n=1 Tax=Candidatus Symbiobacter mobilis CR TaxID=946483 RepID=U5NCN7_9BURK|nr:hypothetical protein Cenrod_1835 [Candidatus Symbiobacter mobilis CR]